MRAIVRSNMSAEAKSYSQEVRASFKTPNAYEDMRAVIDRRGFVAASADHRFKVPFGRDGLEFIEDTMEFEPEVARRELLAVASLQGSKLDPITHEEPGKIFHEHRFRYTTNEQGERVKVDPDQEAILDAVLVEWGVAASPEQAKQIDELTVYYNSDTTQMFINRVAEYCKLQGSTAFLDEIFTDKDGESRTIRDAVDGALGWIEAQMEKSPKGLVEFHAPHPASHRNNYWKDGWDSLMHEDGSFPNYEAPIASLLVNGLTYDALQNAAELFADDPVKATLYKEAAHELQKTILDEFWMEDKQFFAMGLDRDPATPTEYRQIKATASDAGAVLRTGILDGLPREEQLDYLEPIAERLFSEEFWTEGGIVCMSRDVPDPYEGEIVAYQRKNMIWIKENHDIARGFDRYGLYPLANRIDAAITNLQNRAQRNIEFTPTIGDEVDYDPKELLPDLNEPQVIYSSSRPEGKQAWSASASAETKRSRTIQTRLEERRRYDVLYGEGAYDQLPGGDVDLRKERGKLDLRSLALCERILSRVGEAEVYKTKDEVIDAIPTDYSFTIDQQEAQRRQKIIKDKAGFGKS